LATSCYLKGMTAGRWIAVLLGGALIVVSILLAVLLPSYTSGHEAEMPVVMDWTLLKALVGVVGGTIGVIIISIARHTNP
jgi:hypothetical protein